MWEGANAFREAESYCDLWGVSGTVLVDEGGELPAQLGIRGVPTNVGIDGDGTVVFVGASKPDALEDAVQQLLGPEANFEPPAPSRGWHWPEEEEQIRQQITDRAREL